MKIITIQDTILSPLTADNTEITADDDSIRVDATYTALPANTYMIIVTPRELVTSIKLKLINELTKVSVTLPLTVTNTNGKMYITFELDGVKEADTFKAVVTKTDDSLLWRGKVYATKQTNIQDFKINTPDSNNIIKM